ncbi:MAG: arsenate reductase ArsC [Promethearchaeota archaeon]
MVIKQKQTALFICTHNSARSQIAEAFLRKKFGNRFHAFSAGTHPTSVHPLAVKVMAELGIDISNQSSKNVTEFLNEEIDYVVTVCDSAKETCPYFAGAKKYIHRSFENPVTDIGSDEKILNGFRRVRDEISCWIGEQFK